MGIGALRKALTRALLLLAALGYGVVRPTLGAPETARRLWALSVAYLLSVGALDITANLGAIDDLTSSARLLLVLPVATLAAIFILWIFSALSKTLSQLQARRQQAKLDLYRNFTNLLACGVLLSVGWVMYEMGFKVSDRLNEHWQKDWIISAFLHFTAMGLSAGVCLRWAPSKNATRYADQDDLATANLKSKGAAVAAAQEAPAAAPADVEAAAPGEVFSLGEEEGKME